MNLNLERTNNKLAPLNFCVIGTGLGQRVARLQFKTNGVDGVLAPGSTITLRAWRPNGTEGSPALEFTAWDAPVSPATVYETIYNDLTLPTGTLHARIVWNEGSGAQQSEIFHLIIGAAGSELLTVVQLVAGSVGYTPGGGISSLSVQAAIAELDAEKATTSQVAGMIAALVSGPISSIAGRVVLFGDGSGKAIVQAAQTINDLLSRSNHSGTQPASSVSDFTAAALAAVTWGTLTGKPGTFPPSAHSHAQSEITGLVTDLLRANNAEALAGTDTAKIMTPIRTKEAIDGLLGRINTWTGNQTFSGTGTESHSGTVTTPNRTTSTPVSGEVLNLEQSDARFVKIASPVFNIVPSSLALSTSGAAAAAGLGANWYNSGFMGLGISGSGVATNFAQAQFADPFFVIGSSGAYPATGNRTYIFNITNSLGSNMVMSIGLGTPVTGNTLSAKGLLVVITQSTANGTLRLHNGTTEYVSSSFSFSTGEYWLALSYNGQTAKLATVNRTTGVFTTIATVSAPSPLTGDWTTSTANIIRVEATGVPSFYSEIIIRQINAYPTALF